MTDQEIAKRRIRSFVLRAGRMTPGQETAFRSLWPVYGLAKEDGLLDFEKVFGRNAPRILEIGFGMGDSLVQMARTSPQQDFIGIEVHKPGVGRALRLAKEAGLQNIRVFCADAIEVLQACIPSASLDRIQLFFPDPWHKKKHHKRRIVSPGFVELVQTRLRQGGVLHIATDWQNYAESILETMTQFPVMKNAAVEGRFVPKPGYRPDTKFEKRGLGLGHGIWDIIFVKNGETA